MAPPTAEFFVACIVTALQYIHTKGVIHRDVKPENLVFDSNGYLHLTDFGIARVWSPNNAQDTSGTPGYMGRSMPPPIAPEVMCRNPHGVAADYFAVGVIAYECMLGKVNASTNHSDRTRGRRGRIFATTCCPSRSR